MAKIALKLEKDCLSAVYAESADITSIHALNGSLTINLSGGTSVGVKNLGKDPAQSLSRLMKAIGSAEGEERLKSLPVVIEDRSYLRDDRTGQVGVNKARAHLYGADFV
jgi:hypothetical protein